MLMDLYSTGLQNLSECGILVLVILNFGRVCLGRAAPHITICSRRCDLHLANLVPQMLDLA
jgi:hypothetical protein